MPKTTKTTSPLQGLLLVDKPEGLSSHDVVDAVRKRLGVRQVGHTGTLDPFATGLLMVLVGEATKLQAHFLHQNKTYEATFRLGSETDTLDRTGKVVRSVPVPPGGLGRDFVERAVSEHFLGDLLQKPPKYSAVKVAGKPAYAIMRSGLRKGDQDVSLDLKPRRIRIHSFDINKTTPSSREIEATLEVSSGTYIRSIARDLGNVLRTAGHLKTLRRTHIADYSVQDAHALGEINKQHLQPMESVLSGEGIQLSLEDFCKVRQGNFDPLNALALKNKNEDKTFLKVFYEGRLVYVFEKVGGTNLKLRMNLGKLGLDLLP